jgi:endonuclease YncB( thermonuclease family)
VPLFLALVFHSTLACAAEIHTFDVYVIRILDGDTVVAIDSNKFQHQLRLAGIDAPEKEQPFGERSRQNLTRLVFNKPVRMEWSKVDRYGRLVAKIFSETTDVNLEQIKAGLAWHYKDFEREQAPGDRRDYSVAEKAARTMKLGLWADSDPIAPWEWRHGAPTSFIKKSRANICHDRSMPSYRTVKHFVSFNTLDECIASGGRLPKGS